MISSHHQSSPTSLPGRIWITYPPALVSVTSMGVPSATDESLDVDVRSQLTGWYGSVVRSWKRLHVDRIARALPRIGSHTGTMERADELFVCGDHVATPSIQGAMESGRRTAEGVQARLGKLNS
ncbi:MAG: putative NAD/FAD-dependent oxidoreductase [Chlamydiales bacterium]|jgi:predicted NAD/FAD-dependent oxidoreductase